MSLWVLSSLVFANALLSYFFLGSSFITSEEVSSFGNPPLDAATYVES